MDSLAKCQLLACVSAVLQYIYFTFKFGLWAQAGTTGPHFLFLRCHQTWINESLKLYNPDHFQIVHQITSYCNHDSLRVAYSLHYTQTNSATMSYN